MCTQQQHDPAPVASSLFNDRTTKLRHNALDLSTERNHHQRLHRLQRSRIEHTPCPSDTETARNAAERGVSRSASSLKDPMTSQKIKKRRAREKRFPPAARRRNFTSFGEKDHPSRSGIPLNTNLTDSDTRARSRG
mmetsp:Transcript_47171/g.142836  ORF Transcript_47171/g.142836 Transcript_47171/m.142836 type:complete len:136 (-) Transcript_47171:256-663(-)